MACQQDLNAGSRERSDVPTGGEAVKQEALQVRFAADLAAVSSADLVKGRGEIDGLVKRLETQGLTAGQKNSSLSDFLCRGLLEGNESDVKALNTASLDKMLCLRSNQISAMLHERRGVAFILKTVHDGISPKGSRGPTDKAMQRAVAALLEVLDDECVVLDQELVDSIPTADASKLRQIIEHLLKHVSV